MSSAPPPKPWERAAATGESVHAATPAAPGDAPKPWEVPGAGATPSAPVATESNPSGATPTPPPRENRAAANAVNAGATTSYATTGGYNRPYGGYGSAMGGYGGYGGGSSMYGGGYGSSMYGGGYGSSMYGGGYGGYGSSMYGNRYGMGGMYGGGMYGGMGMGPGMGPMGPGMGGPMGAADDPNGPAPTAWQRIMRALHGIVTVFGRISWLVDENSQALHFFMMGLMQLLDRAGVLYGELARFALRLLGYKVPDRPKAPPEGGGAPGTGMGMGPGGYGMGGVYGGGMNSGYGYGASPGYGGGGFESAWGGA